jgi:hypothetical protein
MLFWQMGTVDELSNDEVTVLLDTCVAHHSWNKSNFWEHKKGEEWIILDGW